MSLYDEAILIQKPSGYKAEKLYNVKPSPQVSEQSSLEFDGVDDCLITDGDSVAQPTTYSFWCKASETGYNRGVFGHGADNIGAFHFNGSSNRPLLWLEGNYFRYWVDTSAQDDGKWHHWVVYSDTNDVTNSKLYCDGVLQDVSSTASTGSANAYTEGLTIGADKQSSGNYFNGSISDFAVFSSELSAADVTEIYNYGSPNDLLLPASYGTDIAQSSTKSVEFDGVDDYLDCGDILNYTNDFTISCWIKASTGTDAYNGLITKYSTWGWDLILNNGQIRMGLRGSSQIDTGPVGNDLRDNKWHYIVAVNTNTSINIYIDGVLKRTSTGTWTPTTTTQVLKIGHRDGINYFNGSIDNVGIYDKALTQAEVTRQYNGGQPIDLSTDATSDSLVAYYKMGDGTLDEYSLIADQTDATLGSELIGDGGFESGTDSWNNDGGATTISQSTDYKKSGTYSLKVVQSGGNYDRAYKTITTVVGKTYKFSSDTYKPSSSQDVAYIMRVATNTGDTTPVSETISTLDAWVNTIGYFTATATTYYIVAFPHNDSAGNDTIYIDDVSIKEVQGNPAIMTNMSSSDITTDVALSVVNDLESYYQMGDGILDNYPLIADQTDTTLGSEVVVNGDFSSATDWTVDTDCGYIDTTEGVFNIDNTSVGGGIRQMGKGITLGKTYLFTFTIVEITSGTCSIYPRLSKASGTHRTAAGTYSEYIYVDDFTYGDRLDVRGDTGGTAKIDNVSVKEIGGNPAMMTNMSSADIVAWTPNIETDFDVARSSTTTRINASGYIEQVAANVPRLNYDSGDSCPYLLTEAAGTNLITYPISFGNSYWTKSGASIEGDSSTAGSEQLGTADNDWDVTNTQWGISGGVLSYTSGANGDTTYEGLTYGTFTFSDGKMYKIDISIANSGNDARFQLRDHNGYVVVPSGIYADGSYSFYFTASSDNNSNKLVIRGLNSGSSFDLTSYSIKEVQGFEAPKEKPSVASELVTDGYPFVNGSWSKQSAWTISNGEAVYGGISNHYIHQPFVVEQDKIYKVEFTTDASSRTLLANESNLQLFEGILDAYRSAGTHIFYAKALHTSTNIRFYGYGSGGAFNMSVLSVKEVTSWSGGGFERDAYKLVEDTATSRHRCTTDNILTSSGNAHTLSVYAKADTRDWIGLEMYGVGDRMAWFDIANGVVGTKQANITSSEIVAMANGWYRCSITQNAPSSQGMFGVFVADEDDSYSYAGENKSVYLSYLQVEESDYASSLMLPVTEGSTTSRVADAITNAGNQSLFSGVNSSGVLYAEIAANSDDLTDRFLSISDGTSVNRINIGYSNTSNLIFALGYVSNSNQFLMAYTLTDITDFHKVAVRYTENDFSFWIDGVEVATDTSGSTFSASTLSECALNVGGGGSNFYGKTKALGVFDYLSDDEMETLTT